MCEYLEVGGDCFVWVFYCGLIDEVWLWLVVKLYKEISINVFVFIISVELYFDVYFEMYESFVGFEELNCNLKIIWVVVIVNKEKKLEIIKLIILGDVYDFLIVKLFCGSIVCDNLEIIWSYVKNMYLWGRKVVCYWVINIWDDDGINFMVVKK